MAFIEKILDFFIPNYIVKFATYENNTCLIMEEKGYFVRKSSLIKRLEQLAEEKNYRNH